MSTNDLQMKLIKCEDKQEYILQKLNAKIKSIRYDLKAFGLTIEQENWLYGYLQALEMTIELWNEQNGDNENANHS